MKNRKLFPAPNPSNGTDDCFDFCVPFDDQGYYYAQPPPPSPPSPLAVPDQADQSHGVSPFIIVLVTVLASFSLLLGYYVVVTKSCLGLCKRRNNVEVDYSQSDGEGHEEFAEENHHAVDHPIWFITTAGLQQSIINSITVVKYRRNEGLIEGTECSVCLNEFREDETLRLLPKCSHAFHIPCIDTWLRSHTNCPLCRAHIVNNVNDNHNHRTGSNNPNSDNSVNRNGGDDHDHGIVEETQMENSESAGTFQRVDQDANIYSHENCVSERRNAINGEAVKSDAVRARLVRSVSMDSSISSSSSSSSSSSVVNEIREVVQKESLRISPVAMKRSRSCGGRLKQRLNLVSLPL